MNKFTSWQVNLFIQILTYTKAHIHFIQNPKLSRNMLAWLLLFIWQKKKDELLIVCNVNKWLFYLLKNMNYQSEGTILYGFSTAVFQQSFEHVDNLEALEMNVSDILYSRLCRVKYIDNIWTIISRWTSHFNIWNKSSRIKITPCFTDLNAPLSPVYFVISISLEIITTLKASICFCKILNFHQ